MSKGFLLESFVLNSYISPTQQKFSKKSFVPANNGDKMKCSMRIEAGLRLYAQLLTNAWRKRTKQLNELNDNFKILKQTCQKAAENLEWKNSCYLEQQYVNEDLTCQFHIAQREIEEDEQTIEELAKEMKALEVKNQILMKKICKKSEKCIARNTEISDLKLKTMQVCEKNGELQNELLFTKEKAEKLQEKNERAIAKFAEYKAAVAQREDILHKEIEKLDSEIQSTKIERRLLKLEINDLTRLTGVLSKYKSENSKASTYFEKCLLSQQVASLRQSLEKTFEHKIFKKVFIAFAIMVNALQMISPIFPTHVANCSSLDSFGRVCYIIKS